MGALTIPENDKIECRAFWCVNFFKRGLFLRFHTASAGSWHFTQYRNTARGLE